MLSATPVKRLSRAERQRSVELLPEAPKREELIALLTKYDVQAPRYTSYPPANKFTTAFNSERFLEHISLVKGDAERSEISLYVHLPFCDTLCYFCGCTMMISNNREKIAEYVEYLKREITMAANLFEVTPSVVQVHWGGGSPTHLTPTEIEDVMAHLRAHFRFADDAEISIEIDPRGLTDEHFTAMQRAGFNRASIGVQDISEDVQAAINRIQPLELTREVLERCRAIGMSSMNIDLIYGLPYQTTESFRNTLREVVNLLPDRIAVYNFAYVPWLKPHQQLIQIETLPAPSTKMALLELAISELTAAGYEYLGMDHFALATDPLAVARRDGSLHRNFQGYSTLAGRDLYGLGLSAIGRVENAFAQNTKELDEYYAMIDRAELPIERGYQMTGEDGMREYAIMRLMCDSELSKTTVERLFGADFDQHFTDALSDLAPLADDGLCRIGQETIEVTETGRFFLRNLALAFDEYNNHQVAEQRFSRTV
jgi:oxygen-independent coproporphyrinogen-3 oxidase